MRESEGIKSGYLRQCETRGLSEATIYMRGLEIDKLYGWLSRRKPSLKLPEMAGEEVINYIKSRSVFRSKVTVYGVVSKLRDFGEYLLKDGIWIENPLRWIKGPAIDPRRKLPSGISKTDQKKIWEEVCELRNEYERNLWLVILSLLYGIGIRRGELERLQIADWDRENGLLRIDGRKTGCERRVPLPEITWRILENYLPVRHNVLERLNRLDEKRLLVSSRGSALSGEQISKKLKHIAKRAGVPGVTMHRFRHTCASDLLSEGIGLCHIQHILGHKAIANTFRYSHVSDPERKKAMSKHPINRMLNQQQNGGNPDGNQYISSSY